MRAIGLLLLSVLIGFGCQTTTVTESPSRGRTRVEGAQRDNGTSPKVTADQVVGSAPCPSRLHDIAGAMLLYFAVNKHLPASLDDLEGMTGADIELDFTCPDSKLPYVYVPTGLRHPDRPKMIILHDPVMVQGKRWCIVVQPNGPGAAQSLEVIDIPEPLFLAYQPSK